MSRSFIHLRRALFGTSCAIVFGFGATQALAGPTAVASSSCGPSECWEHCMRTGEGEGICTADPYSPGMICVCY
jgi:hypothetical protein